MKTEDKLRLGWMFEQMRKDIEELGLSMHVYRNSGIDGADDIELLLTQASDIEDKVFLLKEEWHRCTGLVNARYTVTEPEKLKKLIEDNGWGRFMMHAQLEKIMQYNCYGDFSSVIAMIWLCSEERHPARIMLDLSKARQEYYVQLMNEKSDGEEDAI